MKQIFAALALASAFIAPSHADVMYTSSTTFMSQLQAGSYTETFSGTSANGKFTSGGFAYTASATGGLYQDGDFLGTNLSNTDLVIRFTGNNVNALGANFYNTNSNDRFTMAAISITLSDGTTTTFRPASLDESYRGFTTDAFITKLTISNTNDNRWVGLDNLTIGRAIVAADVPEPASLAIMGAGMVGLMAMRRRRKA
jgi:hypothetical protein